MPTWMIVEDEPDMYELLLAMFAMDSEGMAFVDGEEAFAWIESVDSGDFEGELPQFALLDIRLPGEMSGIDIAKRIRKSQRLRHIAVILNTAYRLSPEEESDVVKETEVDAFWYKPLPKINVLQDMIAQVIANRLPPQR